MADLERQSLLVLIKHFLFVPMEHLMPLLFQSQQGILLHLLRLTILKQVTSWYLTFQDKA
jgi:hypothetical protein